jgi:hypothetical protein
MKGLIALDIDGTITTENCELEGAVADYFAHLHSEGWNFLFVTGRHFGRGLQLLSALTFPYYFAPHNGAIAVEMPDKRVLLRHYLDRTVLPTMEDVCRGEESHFVIYGGYGQGDNCYFCPGRFSPYWQRYLTERCAMSGEIWTALESYAEMPLDEFAAVKCFGNRQLGERLAAKIEQQAGLHAPLIRDPFGADVYVIQGVNSAISKGNTALALREMLMAGKPIIAAGDDFNDLSMLAIANIAIVMGTAPPELMKYGDIIAPPASELGIITALRAAVIRERLI